MEPHKQMVLLGESSGRQIRFIVSILASIAVSFLILFGITQARQTDAVPDELPFEDLRSVVLPTPPPPPPTAVKDTPLPPSLQHLDVPTGESSIKISMSPAPVAPSSEPPVFKPTFDFSPDAFKPSAHSFQKRYVYQKSEVDQPAIPIYKKYPSANLTLMGDRRYSKISLMYIVNTSGRVESVRMWGSGGDAFDKAVMEGIKDWRFKPAIKEGKKVDCWVRHSVVIKEGNGGSPFRI